MSTRTPFIAGNWKMNKTIAEAEAFIAALLPQVYDTEGVDVAICPPYLALQAMVDSARGSRVGVYAQNMHAQDSGAFTGEVSAPMLTELDVDGVVLGHSERRQYFNETDRALQAKVPRALEAGLVPILCVGETEEERERGDTERKLRHQVQEALEKVAKDRLPEIVIASVALTVTVPPRPVPSLLALMKASPVSVSVPARTSTSPALPLLPPSPAPRYLPAPSG